MKKQLLLLMTALLAFVLVACSGPKDIKGTWKTQDSDGALGELVIDETSFTLDGESYDYKEIEKGPDYHLVQIGDVTYTISFPEGNDKVVLLIENWDKKEPLLGTLRYTMGKDQAPDYRKSEEKYMDRR